MSVTPVGDFSLPLDLMCDLVAGTAKFQSWTGAASAAAAKASTHIWAVNDPSDKYPLAVIGLERMTGEKETSAVAFDMLLSIAVTFSRAAADMSEDTPADERIAFQNDIGTLFSQMRALQASDQSLYPAIVGIEELAWALPDSDNAEDGERLYGATIVYTVMGYSG